MKKRLLSFVFSLMLVSMIMLGAGVTVGVCAAEYDAATTGAAVTVTADEPLVTKVDTTTTGDSTTKTKEPKNLLKIILISVGISAVVSVVSVIVIRSGYKSNGKSEPYPYDKKAPLNLTLKEDTLIDTQVTKTKIEREQS